MTKEISLETIAKGQYCGHETNAAYVIKDQEKWQEMWDRTHELVVGAMKLPAVDFTKEMVLAVYMGTKPTGNYEIQIEKVIKTKNVIEVRLRETKWSGITIMACSAPYHIAKIPTQEKEVRFVSI